MNKILRIFKLLLAFIVGIAGMLFVETYSAQHSIVGTEKTVLICAALLPALLLYWLMSSDVRKTFVELRRPVPFTVWVWRVVGLALACFGFFLFIGNRSGQFLSFPFAGTIVCVVGMAIIAVKGKG